MNSCRPPGQRSAAAEPWILLFLLILPLFPGFSAPGDLIQCEYDRSYTPAEISAGAAPLYEDRIPPPSPYPVDVYWVRYESTYIDGSPITITAQLFIPSLPEPMDVPVYVFAPGSTGLIDPCRVSREHTAGIHWGLYRSHVLLHAGQGAVGFLPDYMGFGIPDILQPVFHAASEAKMMLDGIRSISNFFREAESGGGVRPGSIFLAGFSQGGHAAFAAADLAAEYAADINISGIIGYGPTTDMQALFREFPVTAPMVLYTYTALYGTGMVNPPDILAEQWVKNLEYDVTRQCIGSMQSYYPWSPRELFTQRFADALIGRSLERDFPETAFILNRNSTGLSGHGIPALILQGRNDPVVSPETQKQFAHELCAAGSPVRLILYRDTRHDTRQISFGSVREWMGDITSGVYSPVSCEQEER